MPDRKEKELEKQPQSSDGLAVASLAVGIFAFLLSWTGIFGLPVSVVAIVFGIVALVNKQNKNLGVAGLVLGIVAFLVSAILLVAALSLLGFGGSSCAVTPLSGFEQSTLHSFRF